MGRNLKGCSANGVSVAIGELPRTNRHSRQATPRRTYVPAIGHLCTPSDRRSRHDVLKAGFLFR